MANPAAPSGKPDEGAVRRAIVRRTAVDAGGALIPGAEAACKSAALGIMKKAGIAVAEMHALALPRAGAIPRPRNVRFAPEGFMIPAREVSPNVPGAPGVSWEQWKIR